jgi:hypothetical protein
MASLRTELSQQRSTESSGQLYIEPASGGVPSIGVVLINRVPVLSRKADRKSAITVDRNDAL